MSTFAFGDQQNTQTPFGGFSFGTAPSNTAALNLTSQSNPTSSVFGAGTAFGGLNASASATTSGVFGTTQTAPAFSTSLFSSSTTTTSAFPAMGQTSTAIPSAGFSFGGFSNPATTTASAFGTGTSLVPSATNFPSTSATIGLGGIDVQSSSSLSGENVSTKKDGKAVKETQLPNEIVVLVESFKKYVKDQKAVREEMSRVSSKSMFKVQEQVNTLKQQLSVVSNGLQRNAIAITKLKEESVQELKNAEIAQRTKDSLSSLQYENSAPTEYFHNLANNFEKQMQSYREQIEQLERHFLSLSQPVALTATEWTSIRRRLHDTFVTLAAQLQTVHQEVQRIKEYNERFNQGDVRSLIEKERYETKDLFPTSHLPASVTYGPSPFKAMQSAVGKAITNVYNRSQLGSSTLANLGFSGVEKGQTGVPFGSSSLGDATGFASDTSAQSQFALNNQKPFQLQKPPAGNKRGKRWTST
ncbi:nucleoporin p58/p45 isoform X2 [Parasteatoda tepidariorum]|uniref:nucleoporin p58/p45 isoform X2 n=1 Tax=Parasteatoda tepidariorum TaxID=114398 RepID=UPI001C7183D9|nr:nucleoporin p58/p45 isoform X2 [Parasteatoda tepidariorum]